MDENSRSSASKAQGSSPDPRHPGRWTQKDYHHPAAGWGAAISVTDVMIREKSLVSGSAAMLKMNQPRTGFDCPGCAWPDAYDGLKLDLCENGIKHVTWEMTAKRVEPDFFARHSVAELSTWSDEELEAQGRLTHPMVYDAETDHYVPIGWDDAFALVGEHLQRLDSPDEASFYTSGRLSNEATFLYQLMVREYGTNNLPDCSNMCHEASGRALQASLGTGKGTADLRDWDEADALFILGVNAASNAPRMLTALSDAYHRGAQVIHVNPLVEAGATRTIVPHDFKDMALMKTTPTSTGNLQVRPGGDMALLRGIAKATLERAHTSPEVLDEEFLSSFTAGFEAYRQACEGTSWARLEEQSGLSEQAIREAAEIYMASERTLISWCLGVSQHEHGVDTVREIVNLLLLRGNIGRAGTGPSPVRGHSNVQGNRTCGIDHRPDPDLMDSLESVCGITAPRHDGMDTVETLKAMHDGRVKVFVGMGGNFALAAPDTAYAATALGRCELTVHVSTKLNRSHLEHGRSALILPCLGRTERDIQVAGAQAVSVEDSMSMVHLSRGSRKPASEELLSEPAIIAGMAQAALPQSPTPWREYVADYDTIRDTMAKVLPGFEDFNIKARRPLGFRIPQSARERDFLTDSGRAEFSSATLPDIGPADPETLTLQTMRSHDQWNTTIYSADDRYRGVKNLRRLIFMNRADMQERGLCEGDLVDIIATSKDGARRSLHEFVALEYDTPRGSAAGYIPEMNPLIGIEDYSRQSDQPLMKSAQVRVIASARLPEE